MKIITLIFYRYHFIQNYIVSGASLVAQRLKHLPAMQETWVSSLSQEAPLEKEMATHSRILAWRIPWTAEPHGQQSLVGYSPRGRKESDTTERPHFHFHCYGEVSPAKFFLVL